METRSLQLDKASLEADVSDHQQGARPCGTGVSRILPHSMNEPVKPVVLVWPRRTTRRPGYVVCYSTTAVAADNNSDQGVYEHAPQQESLLWGGNAKKWISRVNSR